MIQPKPRFSPKFSARNRRNLVHGGFGLLTALLISWGCGEAAPYPGPTGTGGTTGGTPAETGGTPAATGGTPAATGGTPAATGGTPAATGGTPAATGGTPAATGGTPSQASIPACVTTVITGKCTVCHTTALASTFGGLDLSGDYLVRLVDVAATNIGVSNMGSCVPGAKLIDTATPDNSVFLKRLLNTQNCGTQMPSGTMLSADEQTCFKNWIQTF
jgi:hypothetical protein